MLFLFSSVCSKDVTELGSTLDALLNFKLLSLFIFLQTYEILNPDKHADFLRKKNMNPYDYRPDIVHEVIFMKALLDECYDLDRVVEFGNLP